MEKKTIKIIDQAFGHELYCGHKIGKNESKHIVWDRSRQINKNDIVLFTDSCLSYVDNIKVPCFKIGWLLEPPAVISSSYDYIKSNWNKFDLILTHQDEYLKISDKFKICPLWFSFIYPEKQLIGEKNKLFSIIASNKRDTTGQRMRHEIVKLYRNKIDIDLFGGLTSNGGYNPIIDKSEGLLPYMFSFVIENSESSDYFSEKLVDCLLCGTIPIYWGAKNIGNYFNKDGIITFESVSDLENILKNINQDTYEKMYPFVKENFEKASKFTTVEDYIYENFIEEILKNN